MTEKKGKPSDFFGAWKDITESENEEIQKMRKKIRDM
jgi:hypothetical protein